LMRAHTQVRPYNKNAYVASMKATWYYGKE